MSTIKELLKIACLAALLCIISPFAWNCRATYRKVAKILLHIDGTAGEMKQAAQKSVTASEHTDEAIVAFGELVADADKLTWKGDDAVDAATGTLRQTGETVGKLGNVATAATSRIDALKVEQDKADKLIEQITTVPGHVNATLDSVASTSQGLQMFISDPAIQGTVDNVNQVAGNLSRATNDLANKEHDLFYPPPCTGRLCPIKKVWRVGRAIMGLAEPAYYGVGIARGQ